MIGKQWPVVVIYCATIGAVAAECPAPVPPGEAYTQALTDLRNATNEDAARRAAGTLWTYWTDAPDQSAQALLDAGMAALSRGAYDRAVTTLTDLVAYCPDYAEGYNQRAFAYFLSTRFEAALDDLDRTLVLRPDHVAAISGRGLTLIQLGREAEGQAALRRALEMHPFMPERRYIRDTSEIEL